MNEAETQIKNLAFVSYYWKNEEKNEMKESNIVISSKFWKDIQDYERMEKI